MVSDLFVLGLIFCTFLLLIVPALVLFLLALRDWLLLRFK